jgi:hypothetical protein
MKRLLLAFCLVSAEPICFAQEIGAPESVPADVQPPPKLEPADLPNPMPPDEISVATLELAVCLAGTNQVPANASPFKGSGAFSLAGNVLSYAVRLPFPNLAPTGGGIYGPADSGTKGDLIVAWTNCSIVPGVPGSTFRGGWEYRGSANLLPEQVAQLKAGLWYANIQSATYPEGELRGRIFLTSLDADSDGDGVPNKDDICPDSPAGAIVDATGCSIQQLVPCDAPWTNHEEYAQAVKEMAFTFWKENRISVHERTLIVKEAEDANCGNPLPGELAPTLLASPGLAPDGGLAPAR